MTPDIRVKFFQVVQGRNSPEALPALIDHARNASKPETAGAALKAARKLATEKDLTNLLGIIQFNENSQIQQDAKRVIMSLAELSSMAPTSAGQFFSMSIDSSVLLQGRVD